MQAIQSLIPAIQSSIPGWMTPYELGQLAQWIQQYTGPHSIIVECGSYLGRSTHTIAAHSHSTSQIYCYDQFRAYTVEPFRTNQKLGDPVEQTGQIRVGQYVDFPCVFRNNLAEFENVTAIPCRLPHTDFFPKHIDFFFFDLDHRNPVDRDTLTVFLPYFSSRTFICGHDYIPNLFPDVVANAHWLADLRQTQVRFGLESLWYLNPTCF